MTWPHLIERPRASSLSTSTNSPDRDDMFARSCLARVTAAPSVCLLKPSATSTPLLSLLRLTNTSKRPFSTTPSHHLPRPPPIPSFRRPSSSPPENQNPPHEKTSIGRITPVRIPASAAIDGGGGNSASAASVGTNQNAAAQGEAVEHLSVDYCMEGKEDPYEVERPNVLAYLAVRILPHLSATELFSFPSSLLYSPALPT
jgi:hypothetical protein